MYEIIQTIGAWMAIAFFFWCAFHVVSIDKKTAEDLDEKTKDMK